MSLIEHVAQSLYQAADELPIDELHAAKLQIERAAAALESTAADASPGLHETTQRLRSGGERLDAAIGALGAAQANVHNYAASLLGGDTSYQSPTPVSTPRGDPIANFNTLHAHTLADGPEPSYRDLNPNGDPAAVEEVMSAIEAAGGYIPFSQYMDIALYGRGGYYSQGKVDFQGGAAGDAGDFETSPERSSDFSGALSVGVCAMLGALGKQPFNLVELGAGSGRMMKDVLAAMRNEDPEAYGHASAYIADYGGMSSRQRRVIGSAEMAHQGSYAATSSQAEHEQDLTKVQWIPGSALELELNNGRPTIIIANEVPDALPADVVRNNDGLLEQKFVSAEDGKLTEKWLPLQDEVQAYIDKYGVVIPPGQETPVSTAVVALQRQIGQLIGERGGMISFDYGNDGPSLYKNTPWTSQPVKLSFGEPTGNWYTRESVRTYPPNFNALELPGELDITYNPDFGVMQAAIRENGMTVAFYGPQGEFLQRCGLPGVLDLETISEIPGLSDASIKRIRRAQGLFGGSFKALVATRGVDVNFEAPRPPLADYREFYN